MAALHEKVLWPLVGVIIFAILIVFYIDDRRRLIHENTSTQEVTDSQDSIAENSSEKSEMSEVNSEKSTVADIMKKPEMSHSPSRGSSSIVNLEFSGTLEEYLAKYDDQAKPKKPYVRPTPTKNKSSSSRSIDEYLEESKAARSIQLKRSAQAHNAFSGSISDYLKKFNKQSSIGTTSSKSVVTTNRSMDDYLMEVNAVTQTSDVVHMDSPFANKKHIGFHGSYEEYAKKFN